MPLDTQEHYAEGVHCIFSDASPDRWGRKLIDRNHTGHVSEQDYIIGVSDNLRLGALRFSLDGGKTFAGKANLIPPVTSLARFKMLTSAIMRGEDHDYSELISNASLGGARPKLVVEDKGVQYIAKVPQFNDLSDVEGWEHVCLKLAQGAGITTASSSLHGDKDSHTLLLDRFDRERGQRVHYMSAMTLMGLKDGDKSTYADLALMISDKIGPHCLEELYRRMLLNILVSNTDDHLRNHGFLYRDGWELSPAFDITTSGMRYGANHALRLNGEDPDTFETALNMCGYFDLTEEQALIILGEVAESGYNASRIATNANVKGFSKVSTGIFVSEAEQALSARASPKLDM